MCRAIKEIRQEEFETGRQETTKNGLKILMNRMRISLEQTMDMWKVPEDEQSIYRKE